MKFSEIWLRKWINPPISITTLINQLTMSGFHVSESYSISNIALRNMIIGKIVHYKKHPILDKVWIIKINHGSKKLITIFCKKIKYKKNLRIVIANSGTILPNGKLATPTIIQGEKSEGVLCTFSMLKFSNNQNNIIELPINAPIGQNLFDYLKCHDRIIDVNIPYNRGDCLSVIGLAREIATINQLNLKKITIKPIKPNIEDTVSVIIDDYNQCPKFLGRIIKNINTTVPTPINIQEKLNRCGIHSINVVTDITNYVLLELGYPIHIFDYNTINRNIIHIRFSKIGETLKLSDDINLELSKNTLIIADDKKPLAIAGVIIGNQSIVSTKTRNIFLQSAFFHAFNIIKQSKLYGLDTISSIRYERGVDYNLAEAALNYATTLLLNICGGQSGPIVKIINYDNLPQSNLIILNRLKLDKILGFHINKSEITQILKNLGFKIKVETNLWKVLVPSWRYDVVTEENLISDIIRIHGYQNIPKIDIKAFLSPLKCQTNKISLSHTKNILVHRGYQEIITYSFLDDTIQKLLYPKHVPLVLKNPISLDMSVMRLSLWPGLIKTMIYNQNRQHKHIRLFESGICFIPDKINKHHILEKLMIAGIRSGSRFNEHWSIMQSPVDFYDIKGDIESVLKIINTDNNNISFQNCTHSVLHPKQSAAVYCNEILIGYIGMIHPKIHRKLDLDLNTFIFELSWDIIAEFNSFKRILEISKFPKNYRDISIIVPNYISLEQIIRLCKSTNLPNLIDIKLIDVYNSNELPIGCKSITIRLTLQSQIHTLKEQEISNIINTCVNILQDNCKAILR